MPALDAARKRISRNGWPRMERQQAFANSRNRALGFCIGDFSEYALRRGGDLAWLSRASEHNFFCRLSMLAAIGRHGILPSPLLPCSADCGSAAFRPTEHD